MNQTLAEASSHHSDDLAWQRALFGFPARLFCYALVAFATCQGVFVAIRSQGIAFAAMENGPVEIAQALMALFASGCLFFAAYRNQYGRPGVVVCACMVGYAAARECDRWFETVFFDDAYKYLAGVPLVILAAFELYRGRHRIVSESFELLQTPAICIFSIAGIYICSMCQVIDRPDLWAAVGEGVAAETTKAAVEEFAELFGYLLLSFSGVEAIAMALRPNQVASVIMIETQTESEPVTLKIAA